jgi:hypothetical protein
MAPSAIEKALSCDNGPVGLKGTTYTMPPGIWPLLRRYRLGYLGPAAIAAILTCMGAAAHVDLFPGIIGGESGAAPLLHWAAAHLVWVTAFLTLWAVGFPPALWWQYTKGRQKQFLGQWKGLAPTRQVLRDLIPPAHARWTGAPSSFAMVSRFVGKGGFPAGLPFTRGKIRDYAKRAKATWSGDRKRVLDFCTAIYPVQGESEILEREARERLYEAWTELSNFWDGWGRECYDEGSIKERDLRPFMPSAELLLLTYLEIALALRTNEESAGKQGLFRLARAVSQKGRPPVTPQRTKKNFL